MKRVTGWAVILTTALGVLIAAWRIFGLMQAELRAGETPQAALRWMPAYAPALMALAELRLREGDLVGAADLARKVLALEPLQGEAFRVLAQVAEQQGEADAAQALYRITAQRAPRDAIARAWLAQQALQQGHYAEALVQIDRVLRMAPARTAGVFPVLVTLARDPVFADALVTALAAAPPWRSGFLAVLLDPKTGDQEAARQVLQALDARGALLPEDRAAWLDRLIAKGQWGEAYARWAGKAVKQDGQLPHIYNGDFERDPQGAGFDWRMHKVAGVLLTFEEGKGSEGKAAVLQFLGRSVAEAGLQQALLLQPGQYRLRVRMRAQTLRSELGLQWQVHCAEPAGVVARLNTIDGSYEWRVFETDFNVPATGCPGQWLRLVNRVSSGAAQRLAGSLWLDNLEIIRLPSGVP